MVRIRPQTLRTRSMSFVLLLLILKTSLTTATPPLAQASVEDGSSIILSPDTEKLSGNSTEVSGVSGGNETDLEGSSNKSSPDSTQEKKTTPAPSVPQGSNSNSAPVISSSKTSSTSAPAPEKLPDTDLDTESDGSVDPSPMTCGLNEQLEDGECVCAPGFTVDPEADPDAGGCPCEDVCSSMMCPSKATCVPLGCGAGYKCECDHGFYNVDSNTCMDDMGVCDMYGNAVCSLPGQECKPGPSSDKFTCECATGYKTGDDESCEDRNECEEETNPCPNRNEECRNTPGSFTCTCASGFVRGDDGHCKVWEQCDNPIWNPCDYKCERETAGKEVTCSCPEGFNLKNYDCVIDDEKNQCQCEGLMDGTWYCRTNDDGVDVCSPKLGYDISETNETIDIDECKDHPGLCGSNSACTNVEGGALCECLEGFIPSSSQVNGSFCEALKCPPGQVPLGSECVDPCSSSPCGGLGDVYTCRATADGTPECYCGGTCMNQLQPSSNFSVYKGSLIVLQLPEALDTSGYSRRALASSLEAVFGRGTIDVTLEEKTITQGRRRRQAGVPAFLSEGTGGQESTTKLTAVFDLTTTKSYKAEDVATILKANCFVTTDDRCPLPGDVVLSREAIVMIDNSDPCKHETCPYPYTKCKNYEGFYGRYTCECIAGFEPTGVPGACKDVDECLTMEVTCSGKCINTPGSYYCCDEKPDSHEDELKKQLDESEQTLTVVSAVLGSFLALALVSTVVFVVLYVKKSKTPNMANISPDL